MQTYSLSRVVTKVDCPDWTSGEQGWQRSRQARFETHEKRFSAPQIRLSEIVLIL